LVEETEPRIPISSLPFTIETPGSYYLTGDLTSSGDGIIVNADNVTIDLKGFSLIGSGLGISSGIYMVERSNVEIRNGTVKNFMGTYQQGGGVNEWNGKGHRVIGVRAISNGRGIYLGGPNHLVKDCTVGENGSYGIVVGNGSTVTGNTVYSNGDRGVTTHSGCTVIGNTFFDNASSGIHDQGVGSSIIHNTCSNNGQWGITAMDGCILIGNTCTSNKEGGIAVRVGCMVKNNTLEGNSNYNIVATASGNSIEENLVVGAVNGINYQSTDNFFANNRASGNGTDYANTTGNTDGGGNVSF
jgi:parallel beta-helix repeat protein